MFLTVSALIARIVSNPAANGIQKYLAKDNSAITVNFYSFLFLSLFCLIMILCGFVPCNFLNYSTEYYLYVILAGILCTLGSVCLIKALQLGEMSVLGPINSYKCVVGLIAGFLFLSEVPTIFGLIGMLLIILGSWFIFDTVQEGGFFKILLRKDIVLRFCALLLTGCEAVVLKKIILMSSVAESFILWCFMGCIFSLILMFIFRTKLWLNSKKSVLLCSGIALCLGVMQYSTNIVFEKLNVGLSLALFQLSGIVAVILGYKFFNEGQLLKKIIGSIIMIAGSCLILMR